MYPLLSRFCSITADARFLSIRFRLSEDCGTFNKCIEEIVCKRAILKWHRCLAKEHRAHRSLLSVAQLGSTFLSLATLRCRLLCAFLLEVI